MREGHRASAYHPIRLTNGLLRFRHVAVDLNRKCRKTCPANAALPEFMLGLDETPRARGRGSQDAPYSMSTAKHCTSLASFGAIFLLEVERYIGRLHHRPRQGCTSSKSSNSSDQVKFIRSKVIESFHYRDRYPKSARRWACSPITSVVSLSLYVSSIPRPHPNQVIQDTPSTAQKGRCRSEICS